MFFCLKPLPPGLSGNLSFHHDYSCDYRDVPVPIEPQYHINHSKTCLILVFPILPLISMPGQGAGLGKCKILASHPQNSCQPRASWALHGDRRDRLFLGSIFQVRLLLVLWEDWKKTPISAHHSHSKPTVLVVGDLVVSVIMEGASVLARVKKLLTKPCNRDICRGSCLVSDTGSRRNVHRPNSALQTMMRRRHNLHFCWKAAAVFRIPMDQPTLRLSLHRGVWSETSGFYIYKTKRTKTFVHVMPIVYAFVVYKVGKAMF